MIEAEYWDCPELIKRIIKLDYKEKYRKATNIQVNIPNGINKGISGLKTIFKNYTLKYRELKFAKKFFPRSDFTCDNDSLIRTKNILNDFTS